MGTIPTRFFYDDDDDNNNDKKILKKTSYNLLHKYKASTKETSINYIEKNIEYDLYLCENDIIIENKRNKHIFIYQNINYWIYSKKTFGLYFKNNNKNEKSFIIFYVNDGIEIAQKLKKITKELVEYYKEI
tara:strand:- start:401 stop:793 length:393 start_codon:yes stop_codon:yes gene_type:complete